MPFLMPLEFPGGDPGRLICRRCGTVVACEDDVVSVMGRPARAAYINPVGLVCEIVTLSAALNLEWSPQATTEHTWFEGYAWRPAVCAVCGLHLGWRYETAESGHEPPFFFGLLLPALARSPAP